MNSSVISSEKNTNYTTDTRGIISPVYAVPTDHVTYNYRYFLPYAPEWGSSSHCRQRLNELITFCKTAKIDAVQFFVNQMPHTIGTPPRSADEQLEWAAWMRDEVAPAIRGANMSYQLNFQLILGHGALGLDMSDEYDWEFLVDHEGGHGEGCACPIGPKFRKKMGKMIQLWANTSPDVIWIDDDFRMHNHRLCQPNNLDYHCFCDRHLDLFSDCYGTRFTRQDIVAEIAKPGTPSIWRRRWQTFISDGMVDTARWIRNEIDQVSPNIRTALMTSLPDTHSMEGRDWEKTLSALSGKHRPMLRPCCGSYSSNLAPLKNHAVTFQMFEQSMETLAKGVGYQDIDFAPELENARFTSWANSTSHSHYVMTLGQLLGCPHITISINDLDGSPLSEEPMNGPMLKSIKPRLNALAAMDLKNWDKLGLAFICDPEIGGKYEFTPDETLGSQPAPRSLEQLLVQVGIPACYVSPSEATKHKGIIALDRLTAWSLSDEEMIGVLKGSVLMDSSAAEVVQRRGFEEYIGVHVGEKMNFGIHSEIYPDDVLPGVHACRVPHLGLNWHHLHLAGATKASDFIDTKYRFYPGSTIYKNELGGNVAIFANVGNCEPYAEWANHARIRHLHGIIDHLSDGQFPVFPKLASHGLTLLRQRKNELLIALANFSADTTTNPTFKISALENINGVKYLDNDTWVEADTNMTSHQDGSVDVCVKGSQLPNQWLILLVDQKM